MICENLKDDLKLTGYLVVHISRHGERRREKRMITFGSDRRGSEQTQSELDTGVFQSVLFNMSSQEENEAISQLTGFSLDHILTGLSLPSGSGLSNQLGISHSTALNPGQIYSERYNDDDDDEAVGPGQGQDWEDEVDREMQDEGFDDSPVKMEVHSPENYFRPKQRRVRVVKRVIERPKTVYERFPAFEKDKVLDFSELFKGYTAKKSRLVKKPFHGMCVTLILYYVSNLGGIQLKPCIPRNEKTLKVSWMLSSEMPDDKLRTDVSKK